MSAPSPPQPHGWRYMFGFAAVIAALQLGCMTVMLAMGDTVIQTPLSIYLYGESLLEHTNRHLNDSVGHG